MKITLNTKEAVKALARGVKAIPAKIINPRDGDVLITADNDSITLTTTDGEMAVVTVLKTSGKAGNPVETAGTALMDAKKLLEMLGVIADDTVTLETSADGCTASVLFSNGKHSMPSFAPDWFPPVEFSVKDPVTVELPAKLLSDILSGTLFNCLNDPLRPVFGSILMELGKNGTDIVTSDMKSLMVHSLPDIKSETPVTFLLSQKQGNLLLSAVKTLKEEDDMVTVNIGDKKAVFTAGDSTVSTKSVNSKFPDWKRILPDKNPNELTIKKDEFLSTLRRVSTCAGISQRCVKLSIRKTLVDSTMEVSASDSGFKISARETMPVDYSGEDMTIGFNADVLLDIVKHIDGESVTIGLTDAKKPALITPTEKKDNMTVRAVLVPVFTR